MIMYISFLINIDKKTLSSSFDDADDDDEGDSKCEDDEAARVSSL